MFRIDLVVCSGDEADDSQRYNDDTDDVENAVHCGLSGFMARQARRAEIRRSLLLSGFTTPRAANLFPPPRIRCFCRSCRAAN